MSEQPPGLNGLRRNGIRPDGPHASSSSFVPPPQQVTQEDLMSFRDDSSNATRRDSEGFDELDDALMVELDCCDENPDSGISDDPCASSSESNGKPEAAQVGTTLMIRLSETKSRLTLLHHDGTIQPFSNEDIPLRMAVVRGKALVYGTHVQPYIHPRKGGPKFGKYKVEKWDLGRILLDRGNPWLRFNFNGHLVKGSVELLFGLFLSSIKQLVEEKLKNSNCYIELVNHVIFSVPLWFPGKNRQRLMDSAEIGGFNNVTIVNDISSVAWFHYSSNQANLGTPFNILVLSENSGNLDLAVYIGVSGVFIQMVAITGNRYLSAENPKYIGYAYLRNLVKRKYEEVMTETNQKYQTDDDQRAKRSKFRIYLIRSLLGELRQKLNGMLDLASMECLVICEESEWVVLFENELKQQNFKSLVHVFLHQQLQISHPRKKISDPEEATNSKRTHAEMNNNGEKKHLKMNIAPSAPFLEELTEGLVTRDLLPYALHWNSNGYVENLLNLCEKDAVASNRSVKKSKKAYSTSCSIIYQRGRKDCFEVGLVEVPPKSYFTDQHSQLEVKLGLGQDGIIGMRDMNICSGDGRIRLTLDRKTMERCWISGKLLENDKEKIRKELKKMVKCSDEYKDEVSILREELWELSQKVADALWARSFKRNLGRKRKEEMQKNVDDIRATLRHVTTGPLLEIGRKDLCTLLKKVKGYKRFLVL